MQDMKKCDSKGRDCIERNSAETFNCSMTCTGIYADINWKAGEMKNEIDKEKYAELSSEYVNFKREYVKHFEFSSETSWDSVRSIYGEKILPRKKMKTCFRISREGAKSFYTTAGADLL